MPSMTSVFPLTRRISVVVADDHPIALAGLQAVIAEDPELELVGIASDGDEAVRTVLTARPDVVVVDLRMPRLDGPEAIGRIIEDFPEARILVLSFDEGPAVAAAFRAGARGFVSKDQGMDAVLRAIHLVAAGELVLPAEMIRAAVEERTDIGNPLSEREVVFLRLVADGRSNDEIAAELGTSPSAVDAQLTTLFDKLGASDRASAVAVCFRRGWLT